MKSIKIKITKNADTEEYIPTVWRNTLEIIANAFVLNDLKPLDASKNVQINDPEIIKINQKNIEAYPDDLGLLSEESWKTSICLWMDDYWEVLVDLTTTKGETSDLVLHAKVYESHEGFQFEPYLIYVP